MLKTESWIIMNKFMPYIHNTNLINYVNILTHDFHKTAEIHLVNRTKKDQPFTKEEEVKIVEVINKSSFIDLKKYNIKTPQWKKFSNFMERNGSFKTFNDILLCQDDISGLIKLCRSILNDGKEDKIKIEISKKSNTYNCKVIPTISDNIKKQIKTIVGLQIWNDTISWAAINEHNILTDWNREKYENQSKNTPLPLINQVINIVNRIPKADAYVMEAADSYNSNKKQFSKLKSVALKTNLDRQQALWTTITTLGIRTGINKESIKTSKNTIIPPIDNFFMLKSRFCADKFNLTVGNEATAGDSIVIDILKDDAKTKEEYLPNLTDFSIDPNILNNYVFNQIGNREYLHSILLITLAFADIVRDFEDSNNSKISSQPRRRSSSSSTLKKMIKTE